MDYPTSKILAVHPDHFMDASGHQEMSVKLCAHDRQKKGYPFELVISDDPRQTSVLPDQVKSVDWKTRQAVKKGGRHRQTW